MSEVIIIDNALVKDKEGWARENAFIVIWAIEAEVKTKLTSTAVTGDYKETSKSHIIEYQGNYWGDKQMQLDGLPSKPLAHFVEVQEVILYERNEDGEHSLDDSGDKIPTGKTIPAHTVWTDKFTVDMNHHQSKLVVNSEATGAVENARLIELDVKRKFPV